MNTENIYIIFLLSVIVFFVFLYYLTRRDRVLKKYLYSIPIVYIDGTLLLEKGKQIILYVFEDRLKFNENEELLFSNIKNSKIINETQITEKEKSVLKRAIVGGVLLGGIGAIIGGMTGLKDSKEKKEVYLFSLDYKSHDVINNALFLTENNYYKKELEQITTFINNRIK